MPWYENKQCGVCARTIGKLRFWQTKPWLVSPAGKSQNANELQETEAATRLGTHMVVCDACYWTRNAQLQALARKRIEAAGGEPAAEEKAPAARTEPETLR